MKKIIILALCLAASACSDNKEKASESPEQTPAAAVEAAPTNAEGEATEALADPAQETEMPMEGDEASQEAMPTEESGEAEESEEAEDDSDQ